MISKVLFGKYVPNISQTANIIWGVYLNTKRKNKIYITQNMVVLLVFTFCHEIPIFWSLRIRGVISKVLQKPYHGHGGIMVDTIHVGAIPSLATFSR